MSRLKAKAIDAAVIPGHAVLAAGLESSMTFGFYWMCQCGEAGYQFLSREYAIAALRRHRAKFIPKDGA